ncbi:MAG: hypothetical protein RSE05_08090 [Clostridium sp.]
MKRILALICFVSVFFMGCDMVPKPIVTPKPTIAPLNEQQVDKKAEKDKIQAVKEQQEQQEKTLETMKGKSAFYIPKEYATEGGELKGFQVLGLQGNVFYYIYDAGYKSGSSASVDQRAHVLMKYDYRDASYKEIHKFIYEPSEKKGDAFYGQMVETENQNLDQLFLYDNGMIFIYDTTGKKLFERDLNQMLDRYYPINPNGGIVSRDITNVVMDNQNNVYIELSMSDKEYDENNTDEKELNDDDIESIVLRYRYTLFDGQKEFLYQEYENVEAARKAWKKLAEGYTYDAPPDAIGDWKAMQKYYKVKWSGYYLAGRDEKNAIIKGPELYSWKPQGEKFVNMNMFSNSLVPDVKAYERVKNLNKGQKLWPIVPKTKGEGGTFVLQSGAYCPIWGEAGEVNTINSPDTSRTFTIRVPGVPPAGDTLVKSTQHMKGIPKYMTVDFFGECYTEELALMVYGNVAGDSKRNVILYSQRGYPTAAGVSVADRIKTMYLALEGETFLVTTDHSQSDIVTVQSGTTQSGQHETKIAFQFQKSAGRWMSGSILDGDVLHFTELTATNTKNDKKILDAVKDGVDPSIQAEGGDISLYESPDLYSTEDILIHHDGQGRPVGVIFTSLNNGVVYAALNRPSGDAFTKVYQYRNLPLYQSWHVSGDKYIAVGFEKQGNYTWENILSARVYEYKLDVDNLEKNSWWTRTIDGAEIVYDSGPRVTEEVPTLPQVAPELNQEVQNFETKEYGTVAGTEYSTAAPTQDVLQGELKSQWESREESAAQNQGGGS